MLGNLILCFRHTYFLKKKKKEMKNFEMVKKKMYSIVKGQVQNIDFLL